MADDDLLEHLYASVTRDDAYPVVLRLLARRFDCPSAALVYVDPRCPEADIVCGHGVINSRVLAEYKAKWAHLDPAPAAMAGMEVGRAGATDRLFSAEERASSLFFNGFFRPLGLAETLGGPVANTEGRFGIVAVQRTEARPPFDDADIADFEHLMRHLAQVIAMRSAFFGMEARLEALEAALEPVTAGVVMLGSDGVVVHANLAARRMLARNDGLTLDRAGKLRASRISGASAAVRVDSWGPGVRRVPRPAGRAPYALRIAKLPALGLDDRGDTLVILSDPDTQHLDASALISAIYGVTPACARLVAALVQGADLGAHAAQAGISLNTAKYHLKSAFQATGLRRQTDLVRHISAVVRDLGAIEFIVEAPELQLGYSPGPDEGRAAKRSCTH